jgi:hypothetical protein
VFINQIVPVRFVKIAGSDDPFVGQPLYVIVDYRDSTLLRPERDFDFLS